MQLTRKALLIVAVVLIAVAAAGAIYVRYVNRAAAECATPAPPEKPATPPPNLPGFQSGEACGPGEAPKAGAPAKAAPTSTGKKP